MKTTLYFLRGGPFLNGAATGSCNKKNGEYGAENGNIHFQNFPI